MVEALVLAELVAHLYDTLGGVDTVGEGLDESSNGDITPVFALKGVAVIWALALFMVAVEGCGIVHSLGVGAAAGISKLIIGIAKGR